MSEGSPKASGGRGGLLAFIFFCAYYLPFILDQSSLAAEGGALARLLDSLLAVELVRWELLRNFACEWVLLGLVYWALYRLGLRLAVVAGLRPVFSCGLILFLGWALLYSANAWLFPLSNYSVSLQLVARPQVALICTVLLLVALLYSGRGVDWRLAGVLVLMLVATLAIAGFALRWPVAIGDGGAPSRNVILLGVDSLSAEMFRQQRQRLPHLDGLMKVAQEYPRAYTPLGRTFPAWVSILSGKPPAEHGAVFNLRSLERVQRTSLLPAMLQEKGYHTVFAIDERRFANIDESFGFDQVVGPKAGALDFVLQGVNDTPLTNLLLQTPLAAYLLPYSYINVAAHANYSADGFVGHVLRAADTDKPLFLAAHFESAHFPFKTRHARESIDDHNRFRARHVEGVTVVDQQIGQVLQRLRAMGVLDDALVILLSDHGEALGELEARVMRDGQSFEVRSYGHGANLLSDQQNRIVLGAVVYQQGEPVTPARRVLEQVSLLDLRSGIEAYVETGVIRLQAKEACLVVETGLRLDAATDYRSLSEKDVAVQAASFYEIDRRGRLRLREEILPGLLAGKDVGWRCPDRLTWYEAARQRYMAYRLDAQGLPTEQVQPDAASMARIEEYRARYLRP